MVRSERNDEDAPTAERLWTKHLTPGLWACGVL